VWIWDVVAPLDAPQRRASSPGKLEKIKEGENDEMMACEIECYRRGEKRREEEI
jgi:hypothetical protein